MSLNGPWDFALDPEAAWRTPEEVTWNARIEVPFAPETTRSGIGHGGFFRACWYRRTFSPPPVPAGGRLLLHFGAVDYAARVWVNNTWVGQHEGGFTPFVLDITDALHGDGPQTVVVAAEDDPADLAKPRGKQDWLLEAHSIWYPRTSGIWQTVWLEPVPATSLRNLRWTPHLARWEIGFEAWLDGARRDDLRIEIKLRVGDKLLANDTYGVIAGEVHRRIALSDPGIDDSRNELLWSPQSPTLIHAEIRLWAGRGELLDAVKSYTALREVAVDNDLIVLNGRPQYLRMVLDQGFWPDTGMTPPDDAALRRDVELAKEMGFNGVRKHQKIEDPRYLFWADTLGLMVWEEMPSAYRFTKRTVERVMHEWAAVIRRDFSHPCIIAWVPFNESWGVPNLPNSASERSYVQALYHLTKTLDDTRPVIGNDGWESVATDIIGIHDYDASPERIARRYHAPGALPRLFKHERPGGRRLLLSEHAPAVHPMILSEFGGIACLASGDQGWGYSQAKSPEDFQKNFTQLLDVVRSLGVFAGYCYTQFADTYQERNGLLYANRRPKFPIEVIAAATSGAAHRVASELEVEAKTFAAPEPHATEFGAPGLDSELL